MKPWGQVVDGEQRVKPYVGLPDNVKEFFDMGQVLNNGVSLSQNNDRNSFFLSFNNVNQKGVMPGTKYTRTSLRLNGQASPKFTASTSINYIRAFGDLSTQGQGASAYDQIIQTPRDIPLLNQKIIRIISSNALGYYGAYTVNPLFPWRRFIYFRG